MSIYLRDVFEDDSGYLCFERLRYWQSKLYYTWKVFMVIHNWWLCSQQDCQLLKLFCSFQHWLNHPKSTSFNSSSWADLVIWGWDSLSRLLTWNKRTTWLKQLKQLGPIFNFYAILIWLPALKGLLKRNYPIYFKTSESASFIMVDWAEIRWPK